MGLYRRCQTTEALSGVTSARAILIKDVLYHSTSPGKASKYLEVFACRHVFVHHFFQGLIKLFNHSGFGFSFGGGMVDVVVLQQSFHMLIVKFFALIRLKMGGLTFWMILQHMLEGIMHGHPLLTLQAYQPGILGQDVDDGREVMSPSIGCNQSAILYFYQIRLPGTVESGYPHSLGTKKLHPLQAV